MSCSIHAFVGDNDIIVAEENMAARSDRTTAEFSIRVLPGIIFTSTVICQNWRKTPRPAPIVRAGWISWIDDRVGPQIGSRGPGHR